MSENVKLPDGWQKVKLSEIIEEVKERNITNNKEYPILTSSRKGIYIQEEYFNRVVASENLSNYKIIRKNEFTYRSMSDNQTFVFNRLELLEVGLVSPAYYVFKAKNSLSTFIKYFLNNSQEIKSQISKVIEGTTRTALRFNQVLKFVAMVPPLPEQRKIAEILETIDNAIEKTDAIIEKYKRIKQGLMQDLFTKGVVSEGEGESERWRLRDENIDKFKDSPLGRIPEEWEVVRLENISELIYGERLSSEEYVDDGDSHVYGTAGVIAKTNKYVGIGESIVIPRKGSINNKFYVCAGQKFFVIDTAFYMNVNKTISNVKFLFYQLEQIDFNFYNEATGVPSLNRNVVRKITISLPPLFEQQRIASILSQIDEAIEKEQAYKEKLERIKKGLMEDLLTGKVRVNHLIEEEDKDGN
ncbi:restriction endonuclease subunit S [Fervidobacterium gondwanense]|uniref:Type I restriction enzyme, S subunit n=1 Tax=Fervidobacterium gondwanense DSM 13020 TaxID=1121883 RepID=A0A1M7TFC6_FERGO|nr:restriction endonuclease subunit S [Fervidobacterium gondwanense]SHN69464.1 type I restriction enzyme, S subunit [Fervidobacterium gondwanense DSM 13020]